jgi:hypothetical protein
MKQGGFIGALKLIEDAGDLLRDVPAQSWLVYFEGVVPFFGLFLFETTDIYESPFAVDRLLWITLLLAIGYVWMHFCQAAFATHLNFMVSQQVREPSPALRVLSVQAILQSSKLLAWPIAAILMIPHSLVTMFYQHTLCQHGEAAGDLRAVVREARHDAGYRPAEAVWFLILILILRALVWINFLAFFLAALLLFHSFTGIENTLTRQPAVLFNPTFLAALCVLAYLALDPVVKAACVLRAFRRRSEKSGLDLRIRLSKLQSVAAVVSLAFLLFVAPPDRAYAAVAPAPVTSDASRPTDDQRIEKAVKEVFRDPNLSWSLPVVVKRKPPTNVFLAFTESVGTIVGEYWDRFVRAWQDMVSRVRKLFSADERDRDEDARAKTNTKDVWALMALFGAVLAAAVFFALLRARRLAPTEVAQARSAPAPPADISREDTQADEQPEDEWLRLALEYRLAGNLRLAIRALYLSCLASLAGAKLISIARGKSNLDYAREFQRRAKRLSPELPQRLRENVGLFEQSWYGSHHVTDEILDQFERNVEFLKAQSTGGAS